MTQGRLKKLVLISIEYDYFKIDYPQIIIDFVTKMQNKI